MARDRAGRYLPVDILDLLLKRDAQLWIVWDDGVVAAIVTQILIYPRPPEPTRLKEFRVWIVAGRQMRAWVKDAQMKLEAYAREHGCRVFSGAMRRGWMRVGGPEFYETGVSFEKVL